jgi:hypothetical protein
VYSSAEQKLLRRRQRQLQQREEHVTKFWSQVLKADVNALRRRASKQRDALGTPQTDIFSETHRGDNDFSMRYKGILQTPATSKLEPGPFSDKTATRLTGFQEIVGSAMVMIFGR